MPEETILVPLQPPHGCRLCLPIPREYSDHAGLVRHLKRDHATSLTFECRACGLILDKLKAMKYHQTKSEACRASIEAATPPPPPPPTNGIRRCIPIRPRKRRATGHPPSTTQPAPESDQSSDVSSPTVSPVIRSRPRRRRTTRSSQLTPAEEQSPGVQPVSTQTTGPSTPLSRPPDSSGQITSGNLSSLGPHQPIHQFPPTSPGPHPTNLQPHSQQGDGDLSGQMSVPGPQNGEAHPSQMRIPGLQSSSQTSIPGLQSNSQTSIPGCPANDMHCQMSIPDQHNNCTLPSQTSAPSPLCNGAHTSQMSTPGGHPNGEDPPSWVSAWVTRFDAVLDEDMMENILGDFIALAHQICNITAPRQRYGTRAPSTTPRDPPRSDASELQRLYKANRKRAFDRVVGGPPRYCTVDPRTISNHFRTMYERPAPEAVVPVPADPCPPPETSNPFEAPFTPQEVATRIAKGHNTAPGPDKIRYLHWRRIDPKGIILSSIFNAVSRTGYVPRSWKVSTTVLIHKKGDTANLKNWRPICLSNTLGKLYTACLADRLLRWCSDNNRLSLSQKGFLNYQGCLEHNFVVKSVIQDARRSLKDCCIAWLDIANAFGNIPHHTLWESLRWHGIHQDAICVLQQLYEGSSTCVRTSTGYTDPIPMNSGVKQGCPISPLLFILALEPAIRRVQALGKGYSLHGCSIDILAYADDVALISSSPDGLQSQLNSISDWTAWAGITFNYSKCGTLTVAGKSHATRPTVFTINGQELPVLGDRDAYRHLGVPTGFTRCDTETATINSIIQAIEKLDSSRLAPWQKIDAINTFIMPKLSFCLTNGTTPKKILDNINRTTKRCQGGTNLTPTSQLADIAQLCHALHLFQSRDPNITSIAHSALEGVVMKRIGRRPSPEDLCSYLNGSMEDVFGLPSKDISSTWMRLRMATRRLKKYLHFDWTIGPDNIPIITAEGKWLRTDNCHQTLTGLMRIYHLQKLIAKPDQGKACGVTAASEASNHFINNGRFTRFADWFFVHRARLSVVALRGHKRFGNDTKRCRRCGYARETLAHVLCHCPPNFHLITRRHNAILQRIITAFRPKDATVLVNQRVPGFEVNCRPDMVVIHEPSKTATIVDVTVPFENGPTAFQSARDEKLQKYNALVQHFRQKGYNTHISAFIIGALGGYDHANEETLQRLNISRRYSKLMKQLMVSDTIRWSCDIYKRHLGYQRQNEAPQHRQR
ncbi:uncharacterized protein LOC111613451 [Centruroides sculpturatus]|uniref:uncharacterized protein LOC111613451 n=1 Tax=Centruroides sculpturatus TaxID=218467 RepID=UPI000C6D0D55|nr:uncharacterized protein LOC111613451 [Centruroides sculpturatus]